MVVGGGLRIKVRQVQLLRGVTRDGVAVVSFIREDPHLANLR